MNVLIDTSVWSLVLRRGTPRGTAVERELRELIREGRVLMVGPVRQEILSGVRELEKFRVLRQHLSAFPDIPLETLDYEEAAAYFNRCRAKGVQGSNTDFLLCAVATRIGASILTTDRAFAQYARVLPVRLHEPKR